MLLTGDGEQLTSRGLSGFAWGARLPLVGVGGAVELRRAHVEEQSFLEVVHHSETTAVSKHHPGTQEAAVNTLCGEILGPGRQAATRVFS